jgi:serine/threonine-protein kinase RsbW
MNRHLKIDSDPAAIDRVENFLHDAAVEAGFDEDQCGDLIIAGTEAANNAILHGNGGCIELPVELEIKTTKKSGKRCLILAIDDKGSDFSESEVADPTLPENLMENSGRGLLIIEHLMDEVNIESNKNGTTVVMVKYF